MRRALEAEAGLRPVVSRPTVQGVLLLGAKCLPCSTPSRKICRLSDDPSQNGCQQGRLLFPRYPSGHGVSLTCLPSGVGCRGVTG